VNICNCEILGDHAAPTVGPEVDLRHNWKVYAVV
jgi:hypothetical protein